MKKQVIALAASTLLLSGVTGVAPVFAATPSVDSHHLTMSPSSPSEAKAMMNDIASGNVKQASSQSARTSSRIQPNEASVPYSFSFNNVGTSPWSSSHFKGVNFNLEVKTHAYDPRYGTTGKYYIQLFRDHWYGADALQTYYAYYSSSFANQKNAYSDYKGVGPGSYNVQISSGDSSVKISGGGEAYNY